MAHKADAWIASNWMGKTVRETGGPHNLNRRGVVEETFFDEKGALHCRMAGIGLIPAGICSQVGDWWCPALHLTLEQQ
jgi:hypothetical protein